MRSPKMMPLLLASVVDLSLIFFRGSGSGVVVLHPSLEAGRFCPEPKEGRNGAEEGPSSLG